MAFTLILFYFALWLIKKIVPLSRPMRSKNKTIRVFLARACSTYFPALDAYLLPDLIDPLRNFCLLWLVGIISVRTCKSQFLPQKSAKWTSRQVRVGPYCCCCCCFGVFATHLSDNSLTLSWKYLHMNTHSLRTSCAISTSSRNLFATISNASSGQAYRSVSSTFNTMYYFA